jgi:hypothetical protein
MYVTSTDFTREPPVLHLGRCSFFSYATHYLRLDRELRRKRGRRPYLESEFKDARESLGGARTPIAAASACAMIFSAHDGYYIPIQNRSGEVMGLPNIRVVAPTFGLEPNNIVRRRANTEYWPITSFVNMPRSFSI